MSVPAQKRLGLDEHERVLPGGSTGHEEHHEESIEAAERWTVDLSLQHDELLTHERIVSHQLGLSPRVGPSRTNWQVGPAEQGVGWWSQNARRLLHGEWIDTQTECSQQHWCGYRLFVVRGRMSEVASTALLVPAGRHYPSSSSRAISRLEVIAASTRRERPPGMMAESMLAHIPVKGG